MDNTLALLLSDGYKQVHAEQFNPSITRLVSYTTPRKQRHSGYDEVVVAGVQGFIKKYLIEYFEKNFFDIPLETVLFEYTRVLDVMLGKDNYKTEKIARLWALQYLPLEISTLEEGSVIPMGIPFIQITNTHPDFAWVVQWVESLLSAEMWKACSHATVGKMYRDLVNTYYSATVDDKGTPPSRAMSDFGFRGMSGLDEATKGSAMWLNSFASTATIPAIPYLEKYYNCDCTKEVVGYSALSTEHAVMTSNAAIDGDERTFVKKLLTEVYPNSSFSMVSDSYDYWNMVDVIIPSLKEEIQNHNGKLLIRPDSGDIVDICLKTVDSLWKTFGGTVNSKGYKKLADCIGLIYGDGVTYKAAESIYENLMFKGYSCDNVIFGVGSLSFNAVIESDGAICPMTRDSYNFASKVTYAELDESKPLLIFKNPKTDVSQTKKSQKGCVVVCKSTGKYIASDGLSYVATKEIEDNLLQPVFVDGKMVRETSLSEIRVKLWGGKF